MNDLDEYLRWHARRHSRRHVPIDVIFVGIIAAICLVMAFLVWRGLL